MKDPLKAQPHGVRTSDSKTLKCGNGSETWENSAPKNGEGVLTVRLMSHGASKIVGFGRVCKSGARGAPDLLRPTPARGSQGARPRHPIAGMENPAG